MKVFIMGMHRSGTSMVTGALKICGLYVGSKLLMNASDNPKGHFEEKRFLDLNNKILRRNGGSWEFPPASLSYQGLKPFMVQFLNRPEWRGKDHVGWKDPRVCITFPLWHGLIHPEEVRIVVTQRKIGNIAASLSKREGYSRQRGITLAQYYRRNIFANVRRKGVKHLVTHFESYFKKGWIGELRDLCEFLDLDPPDNKLEELFRFIDPKLYHHKGAS